MSEQATEMRPSKAYRLVKHTELGTIALYQRRSKTNDQCIAHFTIAEWAHLIANPEIITPPTEEKEELIA